jgi:hypothetical protein
LFMLMETLGQHLSIPVSWDFPLHPRFVCGLCFAYALPFNSRFLGFSVAPILNARKRKRIHATFNSRFLGFSVAPTPSFKTTPYFFPNFQFPFLGIFRCTRAVFSLISRLGLFLT